MRKIALLSALHFGLTLACLLAALTFSSMDDDSSSLLGGLGEVFFRVLAWPCTMLWERFGSGLSDAVEWSLFGANSLLWGCALAWAWNRATRRAVPSD